LKRKVLKLVLKAATDSEFLIALGSLFQNVGEQVIIGVGFTCDWFRKWHSKPKTRKTRITSDTQLKSVLFSFFLYNCSRIFKMHYLKPAFIPFLSNFGCQPNFETL